MLDGHACSNAASGSEVRDDFHLPRLGDGDEIVQNHVRHVLVEGAVIAELLEVQLQRFQLEALRIGHISNRQCAEVGLSGLRADGSEFGANSVDQVVPLRVRIVEDFENVSGNFAHGRLCSR